MVGVGGSLDFLVGEKRRAPAWMQRSGLEWLHRTWTEGPALFFLALVLIWLYERTGRLVASMTLHAVNNGVALLALMAYQAYGTGNH